MMEPKWEIVESKTSDYWMEVTEPDGWYYAVVRWDGCIHYYRYFNQPRDPLDQTQNPDYMHICELEREIERLIKLKEIAVQHFGESWLKGY